MELCTSSDRKNATISLVRFVSMVFIVVCHFMQYYNMKLAFLFNVGVQMFFCLSGFLYGNKKIDTPLNFIVKNFKKILIPYWIFIVFAIGIYSIFAREYINVSLIVKMVFASLT